MEYDAINAICGFYNKQMNSMIEDPAVRTEFLALQLYLIQMEPSPKDRSRQMESLQLAYDNICKSSLTPSRERFREIATKRYHWTDEEFDDWAGDSWAWAI